MTLPRWNEAEDGSQPYQVPALPRTVRTLTVPVPPPIPAALGVMDRAPAARETPQPWTSITTFLRALPISECDNNHGANREYGVHGRRQG